MVRDPDRPIWHGQRPWFEIWFAVVFDAGRRRALWLRQTLFVPKTGEQPRATIWGAWFDADAPAERRTYAAKRFAQLPDPETPPDGDVLVQFGDDHLGRHGAVGRVDGLAWDCSWSGGRTTSVDVPAWLPAPTHARPIIADADATAKVTIGGETIAIAGRALAMHLWGKRRVPTLHWIYAPWLDDASLEVTAVSLRDRFALGFASLRLDGPTPFAGRPATAAHPHGLITATVAGPRRLAHARAWAEPAQMVGYVYRDTDERDLLVAQSDIGSAYYETFARTAPGAPWRPVDKRRTDGGVAVEIHQRAALPDVRYVGWDETKLAPAPAPAPPADDPERVEWPAVSAICALGLTYADHVRETGHKLDPSTPIVTFGKHLRTLVRGEVATAVPSTAELRAAVDDVEPGLGAHLAERFAWLPAVMDYEGEVALVALGAIDVDALARGVPQPFGFAAANDLTARIVQVLGEDHPRQLDFWAAAKSFKRFLPAATRVWAPAGGVTAMPELTLETRVNGEVRQRASTKLMIYDLPAIARAASAWLGRPLARGDVVVTGTPAGVGLRLNTLKRTMAGLIKDRLRKAELLVSSYAGSAALLRPGDVVEVDAGPAGRVRTRLTV